MNELVRQTLCDLIRQHGQSLLTSPPRLRALLSDYCPGMKREINVLCSAIEQGAVRRLGSEHRSQPWEMLANRLATALADELGLDPQASRWAIESWGLALGVEGAGRSVPVAVLPNPHPAAPPNTAPASPMTLAAFGETTRPAPVPQPQPQPRRHSIPIPHGYVPTRAGPATPAPGTRQQWEKTEPPPPPRKRGSLGWAMALLGVLALVGAVALAVQQGWLDRLRPTREPDRPGTASVTPKEQPKPPQPEVKKPQPEVKKSQPEVVPPQSMPDPIFLALTGGKVRITGRLETADRVGVAGETVPAKLYVVFLDNGKTYRIEQHSKKFDARLRVEGPDGKVIAPQKGEPADRLLFRCMPSGKYRIYAGSSRGLGQFDLEVREQGSEIQRLTFEAAGIRKRSEITADDLEDPARPNCRCKTFLVPLLAGRAYQLDLRSTAVDSYLRLLDANGKQVAADDDSGGNRNARILYACKASGDYQIIATTFGVEQHGTFELEVQNRTSPRLELVAGKTLVKDRLDTDDPRDSDQSDAPCKIFTLAMENGRTYQIDHRSKEYDAYLRLEGPDGKELARDDDGGGYPNAQITHNCRQAGQYTIYASALNKSTGPFELEVTETQARLVLVGGSAKVTEVELQASDPGDPGRDDAPSRLFVVSLRAGRTFQIDQKSKEFDSHLRLVGPDGKEVARDDDGGDGLNARIRFQCDTDGDYKIYASSYQGTGKGKFDLEIAED